ncbi:cupredoxin domain-containing protein [Stutzerimonas nitrititolerans]|uniref:cupredoxin domain-containing protein n=1 Tax=Stutzerimonas nitrititolerans TaxID=2482751 RepID=UPI0032E7FD3C
MSSAARQATKHERIVGGTGSLCRSAQRYASPHIQPEGIPMYRKPLLLFSFLLGSLPTLALANAGHAHDHQAPHGHEHTSPSRHADHPAAVDRTIEVSMDDRMRFEPAHIEVKAGETVRFQVRNDGQLPHEMVIGTLDELQAHAEQMRDMPGMPHDEPNAVALDAGQQGDLLWHFSQPATLDFACLIAGHLEAGMKGSISVQ